MSHRPRPVEAVASARRQRAALGELAHRPWSPPGRGWFMGQSWRDLLFAHWRVDAEALRRVIPPHLRLDLYDGEAWVGITPFRVEGFRLRGTPPAPGISRFCEVNARTYVTHGDKPGIYFLSLDTHSRLAVLGARRTYRLPYFRARQSLSATDGGFRFRSVRTSQDGPAARLDCGFAPSGAPFQARSGTLEHWLTERYCLYTLTEDGIVQRGEIHHPPWPLQPATASFEVNSMVAPYRLDLHGAPLLHYAKLQDVVFWTIEPAAQ